MIFNINNLHNADYFVNIALSNINNNLNYFIMKRIKKTRENLIKVGYSICHLSVDSSFIPFYFDEDFFENTGSVRLVSRLRTGIGSSILSMIPCNFHYRILFEDYSLILIIWL